MDQVDRPRCDVKPTKRTNFDMSNRDPPHDDGDQGYDEVDRPGKEVERPSITSDQLKDEKSTTDLPPIVTFVEESSSIDMNGVSNGNLVTTSVGESRVRYDDINVSIEDYCNIELTEQSFINQDNVDSRPNNNDQRPNNDEASPSTSQPVSQASINTPVSPDNKTDGPFDKMFTKPTRTMKHVTNETDREGITSSHTVYFPQEPPKNSGIQYSVNSDDFYDMRTFPRGRLTLINVKLFKKSSGMSAYPRHGTDRDADGLCKLFLELGFQVDRYDNPTKAEIKTALKVAASDNYSNLSCCACAMLSHGEENLIYGTDEALKISDITSMFKTQSLAGKPKLFLFQACQGTKYMESYDAVDGRGDGITKSASLQLPVEADFLYGYSTVPGFYSWRNSSRGSWFMESIISVFRESAHKMDIMRMLMRVNAKMSGRKSHTDDYVTDNKRQIGSFVTQMRKEFFFFPPYGPLKKREDAR